MSKAKTATATSTLPVQKKRGAKPTSQTPAAGIQIIGTGKYPLCPITSITIVERPKPGEESQKLFYNPRDLSSFTPERMESLCKSIRSEGLIEPILANLITGEGGEIVQINLIAGERRYRTLRRIYDEDLPVFNEDAKQPEQYKAGDIVVHRGLFGTVVSHSGDKVTINFDEGDKPAKVECSYADVYPTVSGREFYANVPCKVVYDCPEERALRLAFTENDQSEPLTIQEEIALVERLTLMGHKQDAIAEILGSNVTWVSQTGNFREQLPKEAFEKLITGQMARHVAVHFLSYPQDKRQALFDATVKAEERATAQKIASLRDEQEQLEDEEELASAEARKAEEAGDTSAATKARKRASGAAAKATRARSRRQRAESESGTIKQGHVKAAAVEEGIAPKKGKMLDGPQLDEHWITKLIPHSLGGEIDDVTGEEIPADLAAIARRTAMAIRNGCTDPISVIREYMVENDRWQAKKKGRSDDGDFENDDDDEDFSNLGDHNGPEFESLDDEDEDDEFDYDKHDRDWN